MPVMSNRAFEAFAPQSHTKSISLVNAVDQWVLRKSLSTRIGPVGSAKVPILAKNNTADAMAVNRIILFIAVSFMCLNNIYQKE